MIPKVHGFTGTREGLAPDQRRALTLYLHSDRPTEFHQGCCIGADEEATEVVESIVGAAAGAIIGHPCDIPRMTSTAAKMRCRDIHPDRPPLVRNRFIVNMADVLLVCPRGPEEQRSGTWATVRYARRVGCPMVFFWSDGSVTTEGYA